jgi:hypothetical protein
MRAFLLAIIVWGLLLAGCAQAQTTPAPPGSTPAGDEAGILPFSLSFVIDGVTFVATCNFSGAVASNCTFTTDHGLNVTKVYTTGSTDLPVYYLAMVAATLALVGVLMIIMIVAFCMWKQQANRQNQGYQQMYPPPNEPYQQMYPPPSEPYPTGPEFEAKYGPPSAYGQQAQLGRKVIHVGLVRPGLPVEAVMTQR